MRSLAAAALAVTCVSFAAHAGEGVYFTFDGGYGSWGKDSFRSRLDRQNLGKDAVSGFSNTALLLDRQMPDGGLFGLHLGYNIAGHVAFEGNLTVHPHDVFADTRGGAALGGLAVRWYPLQGLLPPSRQYDLSFSTGMVYALDGANGIHGPDASGANAGQKLQNTGRGFDGVGAELGLTAELYPVKWLSVGLTPRIYIIDPLRYFVSFDHRDQGGAIPLSGAGSLTFYSLSLSISFHFEPQPG